MWERGYRYAHRLRVDFGAERKMRTWTGVAKGKVAAYMGVKLSRW